MSTLWIKWIHALQLVWIRITCVYTRASNNMFIALMNKITQTVHSGLSYVFSHTDRVSEIRCIKCVQFHRKCIWSAPCAANMVAKQIGIERNHYWPIYFTHLPLRFQQTAIYFQPIIVIYEKFYVHRCKRYSVHTTILLSIRMRIENASFGKEEY